MIYNQNIFEVTQSPFEFELFQPQEQFSLKILTNNSSRINAQNIISTSDDLKDNFFTDPNMKQMEQALNSNLEYLNVYPLEFHQTNIPTTDQKNPIKKLTPKKRKNYGQRAFPLNQIQKEYNQEIKKQDQQIDNNQVKEQHTIHLNQYVKIQQQNRKYQNYQQLYYSKINNKKAQHSFPDFLARAIKHYAEKVIRKHSGKLHVAKKLISYLYPQTSKSRVRVMANRHRFTQMVRNQQIYQLLHDFLENQYLYYVINSNSIYKNYYISILHGLKMQLQNRKFTNWFPRQKRL